VLEACSGDVLLAELGYGVNGWARERTNTARVSVASEDLYLRGTRVPTGRGDNIEAEPAARERDTRDALVNDVASRERTVAPATVN
jgi:hypothetical protein